MSSTRASQGRAAALPRWLYRTRPPLAVLPRRHSNRCVCGWFIFATVEESVCQLGVLQQHARGVLDALILPCFAHPRSVRNNLSPPPSAGRAAGSMHHVKFGRGLPAFFSRKTSSINLLREKNQNPQQFQKVPVKKRVVQSHGDQRPGNAMRLQ